MNTCARVPILIKLQACLALPPCQLCLRLDLAVEQEIQRRIKRAFLAFFDSLIP